MIRKFTTGIGDGENTVFTVNHGLGTHDVVIQVYHALSGAPESVGINRMNENEIRIEIPRVIKQDIFKVVVIG